MANEQNLIPQAHELTVEEASKGGKNSAKARQAKKRKYETWRELGEMFLPMALKAGKLTTIKSISDVDKHANITAEEAIFFSLLNKAMKGDVPAIRELFEMTGWNASSISADDKSQSESTFIKALEGKAAEAWNDDE